MKILFFISLFTFMGGLAFSQKAKQSDGKGFLGIKRPDVTYSELDSENFLFEEEFSGTSGSETANNNDPHESFLSKSSYEGSGGGGEEPGSLASIEEHLSEEREEEDAVPFMHDSLWLDIADYYAVWNSSRVDPYHIDPLKFKDTLCINLCDTVNGFSWSMPLKDCHQTSHFGMRHYRWHYGTDLKLNTGDSVLSAFDGIVRVTKYDPGGYGKYIVVRHYNGFETLYGHLSDYKVEIGDVVRAGDLIALGGNTGRSTGPHLHFEVRYEGNAINPEEIYDFEGMSLKSASYDLSPETFAYVKEANKIIWHRVRRGDTLYGLSRRYGLSVRTICRLNGITSKSVLRVGQSLRVR